MNIYSKILRGGLQGERQLRKTRFHDEKGNFTKWRYVLLHAPITVFYGILHRLFGFRPELPILAYSSIKQLKKFLGEDSRVLEFGSGMSTVWFAKHAKEVYSVENDDGWYNKVTKIFKDKNLSNVTYKLTNDEHEYSSFMTDDTEGFDLVLVDGKWRSKCISMASKLVKPGGILYLDNSDKDSAENDGDMDMRVAESYLRTFAEKNAVKPIAITDFVPAGNFFVEEGMYVKLPTQQSDGNK